MKKYLLGLLLLLTAGSSYAQKNVVDEVVWMVGDESILLSDIQMQKIILESEGTKIPGDPNCTIPEQIAVQKLLLNQAKIDSLTVNESMVMRMVNAHLNDLIARIGSKEKLEEYFNKSFAEYRDQAINDARNSQIASMMRNKVIEKVYVYPSEIRSFYKKIPQDSLPFIPATTSLRIISVRPSVALSEIDQIKKKLREFTEEVNSGKRDFSTLARLYSDDRRTARLGGEYGFVARSALEPEFADVVFGMNGGTQRVSPIIKTQQGYDIVQLIEKRGDMVNFRHILLRPQVSDQSLMEASKLMDSVRTLILDKKVSFANAAMEYSMDDDTKNAGGLMVNKNQETNLYNSAQFRYEDLPQEVAKKIQSLKPGEITQPFDWKDKNGIEYVSIVQVENITPAHRANLDNDYQLIKSMALQNKQQEVFDKWIRAKQKETYVYISPEYKGCHFKYPGWGENSISK